LVLMEIIIKQCGNEKQDVVRRAARVAAD